MYLVLMSVTNKLNGKMLKTLEDLTVKVVLLYSNSFGSVVNSPVFVIYISSVPSNEKRRSMP